MKIRLIRDILIVLGLLSVIANPGNYSGTTNNHGVHTVSDVPEGSNYITAVTKLLSNPDTN